MSTKIPTIRSIPESHIKNELLKSLVYTSVWTENDVIAYYLKPSDIDRNGVDDLLQTGTNKAFVQAYAAWASVTNLDIKQVFSPQDAVWIEQITGEGSHSRHHLPYLRDRESSDFGGYYDIIGLDLAEYQSGGQIYSIILHEIGHGLGLKHPHDGPSPFPGLESSSEGSNHLNTMMTTVMSYNWTEHTSPTYGNPATPMAFDIAAMQLLYGKNLSTARTDNTYILPTSNKDGTAYRCIWDASGTDTIVVGPDATTGATIDLRAATLRNEAGGGGWLSSVRGIAGGLTIANDVVIENAVGSKYADKIIGNDAANRIDGQGGGYDVLSGLGGNDVLIAGKGSAPILFKPDHILNHTKSSAISLNDFMSLSSNSNIDRSTSIPHATVEASLGTKGHWYKFTAPKEGRFTIDIDSAKIDTKIKLYNQSGDLVASSADTDPSDKGSARNEYFDSKSGKIKHFSSDPMISYDMKRPGIYFVHVEVEFDNVPDHERAYSLHVSVPGASVKGLPIPGSTLDGGHGADTLLGDAGVDRLLGGTGDDVIDGARGADTALGGKGNDTYTVDSAADRVIERAGEGHDVVKTTVTYQLAAGQEIEELRVAAAMNKATLTLVGNEFANTLIGGNGVNKLDGGLGNDTLVGRGGADTFVLGTKLSAGNVDRIADFSHADDTIHIDDRFFAGLPIGVLAAHAFKNVAVPGAAVDADDRLIYDSRNGSLFHDANGSAAGQRTLVAILDNKTALDHTDILVV